MPDHYFSADPDSPYSTKTISTILRNQIFEFYTAQGVFSANKIDTGTQVLIKRATIPKSGTVLDLGCGIGVVGIVLGVIHPELKVHFIDINSRATDLAKKNVQKYKLRSSSIFTGDYITILEKNTSLYDSIYFNPPIRLGKKVYLQHIIHALKFLKSTGYMDVVIKKKLGAESAYNYIENILDDSDFHMTILGKNSGYWVFEIQKQN